MVGVGNAFKMDVDAGDSLSEHNSLAGEAGGHIATNICSIKPLIKLNELEQLEAQTRNWLSKQGFDDEIATMFLIPVDLAKIEIRRRS
jgi:hypothetical protein